MTGAMPVRRNTKDPVYLVTLKAYVAELLRRHDLFFIRRRAQLQRGAEEAEDRSAACGAAGRCVADLQSFRRRSRMTSCSRTMSSRGRV